MLGCLKSHLTAIITFILISVITACSVLGLNYHVVTGSSFIRNDHAVIDDKTLIRSSNELGLNIFKAETNTNKTGTVIISPLSLFTALNVAADGASGSTKEQMKSILGVTDYSQEKLCTSMNSLINYTVNSSEGPGSIKINNSLWIDKSFNVKNDFISRSKKYYNADVFNQKLTAQSTLYDMNRWINKSSGGLIQNPISNIEKNTKLQIFNVLHFVGKWTHAFEESKTKKDTFTTSLGENLTVDMMNDEHTLPYYEDDNVKACKFYYYNGSMMILLPKGNIDDFTSNLTADNISNYNSKLIPYSVKVKLPRLNIGSERSLKSDLMSEGMTLPFDASKAEFDNIKNTKDTLFISGILHECSVKLDEKGTEAAALTSIAMATSCMPSKEIKEFYVNKPFIFIIQKEPDLMLFIGKVEKPNDK